MRRHNMTGTPTYHVWEGIKTRCYNPNDKGFKNYGARGIIVCDRWLNSFENFLEDMGERPGKEYSLDRENNDGPYSPENCKWSLATEQSRNRRRRQKKLTLDQIADIKFQYLTGTSLETLSNKFDTSAMYLQRIKDSVLTYTYKPFNGAEVKLLNHMNNDLDIVNSARISFNKKSEILDEGNQKLINYLMKNKHGSVFESVELQFHIKCPIFVAREFQRHRISSFSEVSGRYVKLELEGYIPEDKAIRTQVGKPGSYSFNQITDSEKIKDILNYFDEAYRTAFSCYEELLKLGTAKELARSVLPVGLFTEFRYKTNARSLMNFISLRNSEHAMYEIRKIAECIEHSFSKVCPATYKYFVENDRVAP